MADDKSFGVMYLVSDEHWSDGFYTYQGQQLPAVDEVIAIEDREGAWVRGRVTRITPANRLPIAATQMSSS